MERIEPKSLSTAIGTFPLPLLSRSVIVRMHPTTRDDLKIIEMLNFPAETQRLDAVKRVIINWAQSTQLDLNPATAKNIARSHGG